MSMRERLDTVAVLLESGMDVDSSGGVFASALQAASAKGSTDVVSVLLRHGADVNESAGKLGSALIAASLGGHMNTVQLLLEHGANVNYEGVEYGSALCAASVRGQSDIVRLLLVKGADINVVSGRYGTALTAASVVGHSDIVRLLVDAGADINVKGGEYDYAFRAALVGGRTDIIRLLFDKGADISAVDERYETALKETLGEDYLAPGPHDSGAKMVQDHSVRLIVTDINEQRTVISLPLESCQSWASFRDQLIERGVQPLQYIQTDEFVVRIDGPATQIISQEGWTGWIAHFCSGSAVGSVPRITLCIIRPETQPCCDSPAENADGSQCESCGMAIVNPPLSQKPVSPALRRSSPPLRKAGASSGITPRFKTQNTGIASTRLYALPTPFPSQSSSTFPVSGSAAPSDPVVAESVTTSFELTPQNSVMRRRNRGASETSPPTAFLSPELDGHHRPTSIVSVQRPAPWTKIDTLGVLRRYARLLGAKTRWLARFLGHSLLGLYSFLIAPPFVVHKDLKWTTSRLENRLTMFQWTMAFNLALAR
ncbi:ankyrin repeat-containing domain protein [Mycena sanguinolenta]|nr:ankyrin repeat-containing domain protein [Mycena sanguinolenta]